MRGGRHNVCQKGQMLAKNPSFTARILPNSPVRRNRGARTRGRAAPATAKGDALESLPPSGKVIDGDGGAEAAAFDDLRLWGELLEVGG